MKIKKIRKKKVYTVYKITFNDKIVYYGHTSDIKNRQYRHNYDCFTRMAKKELYNFLRLVECRRIQLEPIREFVSKTNAKRYESYLILQDYFNNDMQLSVKQTIPKISDF